MKKILKFIIGGFAVIGLLVVLAVAGAVTLALRHEKPKLPSGIILTLDFTREIREKADGGALDLALGKGSDTDLRDMVSALDLAARDERVKIVIGNLRDNTTSLAAIEELRDGIMRLGAAGKKTYAFSTSFGELGPGDHAYYLASSFQNIWLQPMGLVGITGLAAQMPFAKNMLQKIGAKADFLHREEYKTAMDMLTENDFTPANAEMLGSILDDISSRMVTQMAADRQIEPLEFFKLIDAAPLTADVALNAHLIDRIGYMDEITDWADKKLGDKSKHVSVDDYLSMRRDELRLADKKKKPATIAYVHATGEIVQDSEGPRGDSMMSADTMVEAIKDAVEDKKVEAILLRIDSPGGSAVASESIRRAVDLAEQSGVPVVVSMGGTAGSGAYWIASNGDYVFADPSTLTGSIGVIAGKVAGTDIWDKLGLNWGMITRGENADMFTITAPFTDAQRAKIDALVGGTYDAFKQTVAKGRDLSPDYVAQVAKGRVWTGAQAADLGLVDALGGYIDALNYTKSLLGVAEDDTVTMKPFPKPESSTEKLFKMLDRVGNLSASMSGLSRLVQMVERVMQPVIDLLQAAPRSLKMPDLHP